jgi:double-strand break repair protein MRE11
MPQVDHIEPGPDTIRILLTTDNHVGYNESDPVRGDDAWRTFEEIMDLAKEQDVDMVLQTGDLFHINKPTKKSLYHVMRILRRCCMGDKPCELELLSDPSVVFDDGFNTVNYEDPNLNVAIPVFSISGNHDDASGSGLLSPLDLLSVTGLVNHFGRVVQTDEINITPVLLQKGLTKLSLFGLAAVRDERLFKTFKDKKVKFRIPNIADDEWFNLMAVHQNHAIRPNTAYLPEHFLPSLLDLVIWGHEHECIPHSVSNIRAGFDVLQPGSSVATSLSISESIEKKVFILNIQGKDYSLEPFRLKTVRPFHMLEIQLSSIRSLKPGINYKNAVTQYLIDKVEELIKVANDEYLELNPDSIGSQPLPLIRLRVDYTGGYEVENPRRFSNRFVGKVANVNSVIQFHRKTETTRSSKMKATFQNTNDNEDNDNDNINIETFINNYLKEAELGIIPESGFNNAIKRFIQNDDKSAIQDFFATELSDELKEFLKLDNVELKDDENFNKVLKDFKKEREETQRRATPPVAEQVVHSEDEAVTTKSKRKAPVRKKPAAATKTTTRARKPTKKQQEEIISSSESEKEMLPSSDEEFNDNAPQEESQFEEINSDSDPELIQVEKPSSNRAPPKRSSPKKQTAAKQTARKTAAPKKKKAPAPAPSSAEGIANLLKRKR